MPYGICKVCGCTDDNPCYHPEHGFCWWVDYTHELCSHCADKSIAEDPDTQHCINSNGIDPFPGVENKNLAALGCPYPDDTGSMCFDCPHRNFLCECDLGINISGLYG